MSDDIIQELVERIHLELEEIPFVLARMNEGWERARRSSDDYYLEGMALTLHGFYMGIERILELILSSRSADLLGTPLTLFEWASVKRSATSS